LLWTCPWTPATNFLDPAGLDVASADALATNDPKRLLELQLDDLLRTMKPGGGAWLHGNAMRERLGENPLEHGTPDNMSYDEFIASTNDPGDLARIFNATYERSGDEKDAIQQRVRYANAWYEFLIDMIGG
jgi:hypothetical protein